MYGATATGEANEQSASLSTLSTLRNFYVIFRFSQLDSNVYYLHSFIIVMIKI